MNTIRRAGSLLSMWCAIVAAPSEAQSPVVTLGVEARTNANPTVAATGDIVAVAWSGATVSSMDIFAAVSMDGGRTFGAPVQVNSVAGEARVSGEEPPQVAVVPRRGRAPEIVVVWTSRAGANWKLLSATSSDGGKTFRTAMPVPGSEGSGVRGWQSVGVDAQGRVSVLWLDHRGTVAADSLHKHAMSANPAAPMAKPDPTERAGLSELYFANLGGTSASRLTTSVCYCCKTSMAIVGDNIYAVWRHVFPGGMRDIGYTISTDRGRRFAPVARVSNDQWRFDGCPDNGPAIAVDAARRAHVAWPTPADGKTASNMALYYATAQNGRTFGPRSRIPTRGAASHPQIVVARDGSTIVAWDEIVDGTRRLGFARARVDNAGVVSFSGLTPPDAGPGQWYPALAASSSGVLAVWVRQVEKGSVIGVARLP
ncbi:MAG: exo-alpha-sialidase [Gemmatimonadaceae bacterium]|nr:exo-alpha-sialidase [Gemmatimonadaceae bacterium]